MPETAGAPEGAVHAALAFARAEQKQCSFEFFVGGARCRFFLLFGAVIRGNREQGVAGIHSCAEQHEELGHELGVVEQELPLPQSGGVRPVLSLFQEKQQRGDSAEQKKEARFAVFLFAVAERMSLVFPGEGEFRRCSLPAVLCR